jgi:para-nitrobenzyl esterase
MKMKINVIAVLLAISITSMAQNAPIQTADGRVKGSLSLDKKIQIFKGIPFAAPPVGDGRWRAPQPVKKWLDVRNCTVFSASPIQNKPAPFYCWSEEFIAQPEPLSEDCLYLNVWAQNKAKKQPVFVWIYGGGLSSGSANCAIYDGEEMARKGVVFVSINYRVGVMGFMAHPELSKESGYDASGNYGFLDQIAALKWIKTNIDAFGGDPDNVTIAGQSAGSFSVNALIASPLAKGLFHKAIAQSGGLLSRLLSQDLAASENQGKAVLQKANVSSIAELRKMPATELQILSNNQTLGRFGTTMDGYVLPTNLVQHFEKGLHNEVPLLTGWVAGDGSLMGNPQKITVTQYQQEAQTKYKDKSVEFLAIFPGNTADEIKASQAKLSLLQFAGLPSHLLAGFNKKHKVYLYQFSHVPPDKPDFPNYGAFHTSEVPYALHTLHTWNRPWQQTDRDLEDKMSSYWVNFAKTGNPNGKNLPEWKNYDKATGYIINLDHTIELKPKMMGRELGFLEGLR